MRLERPRCFFCKKQIEYIQMVFAVTTPAGPGFAHIDHVVPDDIKRVQNEALTYTQWCDMGLGLDLHVKEKRA